MKKNFLISILMTVVTTILLRLRLSAAGYRSRTVDLPAQGQRPTHQREGKIVGSSIIGQGFSGPGYFHSRPSAAGNGYDAANSGGSNFWPDQSEAARSSESDVATAQAENPGIPVPIDLVTTSASGLDPHITPASAEFQLPRIAKSAWDHNREVANDCGGPHRGQAVWDSGGGQSQCAGAESRSR